MADKVFELIDPESSSSSDNRAAKDAELWLRITAFLSVKSPSTQVTYAGIIRDWCGFLGATAGSARAADLMIRATDLDAIGYRNWLEKQPGEKPRARDTKRTKTTPPSTARRKTKRSGLEHTLSNATIAKKFAALRRIYRMLQGCDLGLRQNPFDSDRAPAPPKDAGRKRPTQMIEFELVRSIVELPDATSPKGLRDRAILAVLFGGGLRRSEVVNLRIADFRKTPSGTPFLYLRSTKANRDAEQALPKWAALHVEKFYRHRKENGAGDAEPLFVSFTGQAGRAETSEPISDSGVYKLFKQYCQLAGAGPFVTPHSARATAITRLLDAGIPHRKVQEFSRHASIQMVELYDKRRISVDENPAKDLDFD